MNKLFPIVKREYLSRVQTKMFIISTLLLPVSMVVFTIVPALLMSIKTGGATRLVIVDGSGRLAQPLAAALTETGGTGEVDEEAEAARRIAPNSDAAQQSAAMTRTRYTIETRGFDGKTPDEIKRELNERVKAENLDAYLIIPADVLAGGEAEYYGRNVSDFVSIGRLRNRLNRVVRDQRMIAAGIDPAEVRRSSEEIEMTAAKATDDPEEQDSGGSAIVAYVVGFLIYFTIIIYGQMILAAVVEEKTTRISEVLFSSARAFPLMFGKLLGVSLVALTQFVIWGAIFLGLSLYGIGSLAMSGVPIAIPRIAPSIVLYVMLFFVMGYFIYATLYALVGAMVTTTQEGGQLATPIISMLIVGFFLSFTVIRSPSSPFSFWVSMIPFFSPITMLVRIVTETPPVWQIALSLAIGYGTVIGLVWLAARVYRVGMLMYGKRATLPEMWRWVRQA